MNVVSPPQLHERTTAHPFDLDSRVRGALLDVIYADQPLSLAAAWVFSVAMTTLLMYEHQALFGTWWLVGMTATLIIRFVFARRYRKERPGVSQMVRRERVIIVGAAVTALFWSIIAWHVYPTASPAVRSALVLLVAGVVAAASRTLACHTTTFCVYVLVASLPLVVRTMTGSNLAGILVGTFAVLYVVLMLGLGHSFRTMVAHSFRLQLENADLIAQLRHDVAAREAAEHALRDSEERLRFAQYALDHAQDLVALIDRQGNFLHVSEALCRYSGRSAEELAERKIWDGIVASSAAQYQDWWEKVKRVGALTFEDEVLSRTGERKPVEINASYVEFNGREAVCAIARDLTPRRAAELERRRIQHQLQETQRLESLGVLAGGVAHDFNNLLTAILGNATLARDTLNQPATAADMLQEIENAANQAAGLCRQMLAYAGRGQLHIEPLNLSAIVSESAKLLDVSVGRRARLELQLDPDLPSIMADTSQIRQVVLNLVHNAAEAIHREDGRIVVETTPIQIDPALIATARIRTEIAPGMGVALTVSDNGTGMDDSTLDRIFEPFFTTKFTGRGLGLAALLGIVRSHRALLHVDSTPGVGSTFRVIFSAVVRQAHSRTTTTAVAGTDRQGRVLVIDDEESVRQVAVHVLQRIGLAVETAADGSAAVAALAGDPNRFTLFLVDMTMPGMDGATTLAEIRKQGATAPAIIMSGFSEQQVRDRLGPDHAVEFLAKPFDVSALRSKVEGVLDHRSIAPS